MDISQENLPQWGGDMRRLIEELKRNPIPALAMLFTIVYFGGHIALWILGITPSDLGL